MTQETKQIGPQDLVLMIGEMTVQARISAAQLAAANARIAELEAKLPKETPPE